MMENRKKTAQSNADLIKFLFLKAHKTEEKFFFLSPFLTPKSSSFFSDEMMRQ